ncbi:uncharacterized protein [Oscarella lobularis]|uniref:uncharacterized protein n=1 Tax=Oscarella lobularis TaxID=121494 RepID=UPI0033140546
MDMYRLDTTNLSWSEQPIDTTSEIPHGRSSCCFVALNLENLLLFGGYGPNPGAEIQAGASWIQEPQYDFGFNNELYVFNLRSSRWESVDMAGTRPEPRCAAAMALIDDGRALLHGGHGCHTFSDLFIVDIGKKEWISLSVGLQPPHRGWHTLSRFSIGGELFFLLFGGKTSSDDFDRLPYYYNFSESQWTVAHFKNKTGGPIDCSIAHHSATCVCVKDQLSVVLVGGMLPNGGTGNYIFYHLKQNVRALPALSDKDLRIAELERDCEDAVSLMEASDVQWQSAWDGAVAQLHENTKLQYEAALSEEMKRFQEKHRRDIEALAKNQNTVSLLDEISHLEQKLSNALSSLDEVNKEHSKCVEPLCLNPELAQVNEHEMLGSGSFGDVYTGSFLGLPVAIKAMKSGCSVEDFKQEILTLHRLRHPNIVTTYGLLMVSNRQTIVSERLEGSLAELLDVSRQQSQPLNENEQIGIALDIVRAVAYLHTLQSKPYIHGDIRPTNVLLTSAMEAKLGDLGAAHRLGSISGGPLSLPYLAPERKAPNRISSSLPSDIYSLGVTLIEIFLCENPSVARRQTQLLTLSSRKDVFNICSRMIKDDISNRPGAIYCFNQFCRLPQSKDAQSNPRRKVQGYFGPKGHKLTF